MQEEQLVWVVAWLFFLICGGIMMLGVYLITRKKSSQNGENDSRSEFKQRLKAIEDLEKRYARGEISHKEYENRRQHLYAEAK